MSATGSAYIPKELDDTLSRVRERTDILRVRERTDILMALGVLRDRLEDLEDYDEAKEAYDEFVASGEKGVPLDEVFRNVK